MKYLSMVLLTLVVSVCMVSCGNDDEPDYSSTEAISGNYVGTIKAIGYIDDPARAYVTLTRKANDAISFECTCETFDINTDPIMLHTEKKDDGSIYLTSESQYAIEGSIKSDLLTITFSMGETTFFFSGSKD